MTTYAFGKTVASQLFVKQCETEAEAEALAAECNGLQYPCGAPATHEVSECVGHDISGKPVVLTANYCDACYEEQASWEETK